MRVRVYFPSIILLYQITFLSCSSEQSYSEIEVTAAYEFQGEYPKYIGQVINGRKEGYWFYFSDDLVIAQGHYKNDKPEGKWLFGNRLGFDVVFFNEGVVFGDEYSVTKENDTIKWRYCENDTVLYNYVYLRTRDSVLILKDSSSAYAGKMCRCSFIPFTQKF